MRLRDTTEQHAGARHDTVYSDERLVSGHYKETFVDTRRYTNGRGVGTRQSYVHTDIQQRVLR